jgi:hypothetical protein
MHSRGACAEWESNCRAQRRGTLQEFSSVWEFIHESLDWHSSNPAGARTNPANHATRMHVLPESVNPPEVEPTALVE